MCRSITSTSLSDASEDYRIPNFVQLFLAYIEEDRGHESCRLVLRYDKIILIDGVCINFHNALLYYHQPFHCTISVEHQGLYCKVEYTNANQRIMPESHNIWVQYMESNLDNTFQGCVPSFPVIYISWTPPNQILQFQEYLHTRLTISTFSKRCKKSQQWILCSQPQQYAVVIVLVLRLWSCHGSGVMRYHSIMMSGGDAIRFIGYKQTLSPHQRPLGTCHSTRSSPPTLECCHISSGVLIKRKHPSLYPVWTKIKNDASHRHLSTKQPSIGISYDQ